MGAKIEEEKSTALELNAIDYFISKCDLCSANHKRCCTTYSDDSACEDRESYAMTVRDESCEEFEGG